MKFIYILLSLLLFSVLKKDTFFHSHVEIDYFLTEASNEKYSLSFRRESIEKASALIKLLPDQNAKLLDLFRLANRYWNIQILDKYKEVSKQALQLSIHLKRKSDEGKASKYLMEYFSHPSISISDSSYYYLMRSEKCYRNLGDYLGIADLNIEKSKVMLHEEDFNGAEQSLYEALRVLKGKHQFAREIRCYTNMGILRLDARDFAGAIQYFSTGLRLCEKDSTLYNWDYAIILNNLGRTYLELEKYKDAEHLFEHGIKVLKGQNQSVLTVLLGNLAMSKLKGNPYCSVCLPLLNESILISDRINSNRALARLNLAIYFKSKNEHRKAEQIASEAYKIVSKRQPREKLELLKFIIELDSSQSRNFARSYIQISDSLNYARRQNREKFKKIEFETEELISENNKISKQRLILLFISVLALLLIPILLIIKYHQNKQNKLKYWTLQSEANQETYDILLEQQEKIEKIRNDERQKIAMELHDGVMNSLASIRFNLDILNFKRDSETINSCIGFIHGIQHIEQRIRNISHNIYYSEENYNRRFPHLLKQLIDENSQSQKYKLILNVDWTIDWDDFDSLKKIHIYRIVHECINNVNKHSLCKNLFIEIMKENSHISLEIKDDGVGFDTSKKHKGIGLTNLSHRVEEIRGNIKIVSLLNEYTSVKIIVPL